MSQTGSNRLLGARTLEATSVAVVTALVSILVWHQTDLTGVRALSNVAIVALVTAVSMTLMYALMRGIDPHWHRP